MKAPEAIELIRGIISCSLTIAPRGTLNHPSVSPIKAGKEMAPYEKKLRTALHHHMSWGFYTDRYAPIHAILRSLTMMTACRAYLSPDRSHSYTLGAGRMALSG